MQAGERSWQPLECLGITFVFGLLAYAPRYFSTAFSHDSLYILNDSGHLYDQISLGRWLQPALWAVRGAINVPWTIGIVSLASFGLATWIITGLLGRDDRVSQVVVSGTLVTAIPLALGHATYIPWVDVYGVALLLAVVALWLCLRSKLWFLAAPPLALSMGLYQSYVQFFTGLGVVVLVDECLRGCETRRIVSDALRGGISCALGLATYWLITRAVVQTTGVTLRNTYNGIADVGNYNGVGQFFSLLVEAWRFPIVWFRSVLGHALPVCVGISVIAGLVSLVASLQRASVGRRVMVLALLLLFPFAIDFVYVISKGMIHDLMVHAFYVVFILSYVLVNAARDVAASHAPDSLWRQCIARPVRTVYLAALMGVVFLQIRYSNQILLQKQLEYEATNLVMSRVLDRIEQSDGYVPGQTPVAFVGTPGASLLVGREGYPSSLVGMESPSAITYSGMVARSVNNVEYLEFDNTVHRYFDNLLGYPINLVDAGDLAGDPEVAKMGIFPAQDSVAYVDGTLVVRFE